MRKALAILMAAWLAALPALARKKERDRLEECATMLKEVLDIPEGIPPDLLNKAECVILFPSVKKGAIGIGASYGRGAITCRTGEHFTGPWSAPAMFALEGLSIGLQIGGEGTDFLLLVVNPRGAKSVLGSKEKLGPDATIAGGHKGRTAEAATDVVMRAEILSYSRSRGLFVGVSLEGSTLRQDNGANKNVYGRELTAREIVREGKVAVPPAGQKLISLLNQKSPKNLSDPKSLE
jgi:lipid-binding SYLF domain-containing protein